MGDPKNFNEHYFVRLLEHGPFERRPRGGWRFGTKIISDTVVERLLSCGRAEVTGLQVVEAAGKRTFFLSPAAVKLVDFANFGSAK